MAKNVLIKPLITESSEILSETQNRFSFVVDRRANKLEIKDAVEKMYGVSVLAVNTAIMPRKVKTRNTKSGLIKGSKSAYKKAFVRLAEGDVIDFYGEL